ncbi:hypothetical protein CLV67_12143 [Actinoplanes italicus]|uniref:Uncharacterized protein n=1 Tax=Actinoplanes italicus TaxID=113567 RepID=A0A2T0JZR1_9ACTN|nr:hypothetical protein CLV67_12143 [Actinoplanes italicus]
MRTARPSGVVPCDRADPAFSERQAILLRRPATAADDPVRLSM